MEQVIEIHFKYQQQFYTCLVTSINRFDTVFFHLELIDEALIEIFNTADISYIGDLGYKKIPAYEQKHTRSLLIHMTNLVISVQHTVNRED